MLVATPVPPPPASATNQAGPVEFTRYAPKQIELKATAQAPGILLLNDRFEPGWQVWVDGKKETFLRCNFLMRGVQLQPGTHTVVFKFAPPVSTLYVSLAATALALALCGVLLVDKRKPSAPAPETAPSSKPQKVAR